MSALTPKRGKKAPPKSKPGKYDSYMQMSHTKSGPGRKAHASKNDAAPRTQPMPGQREPAHIVKPVRAARRAEDTRITA